MVWRSIVTVYNRFPKRRQHALEAYVNAKKLYVDNELSIAALLHDIGHVLEGTDGPHELTGAAWLRSHGFSKGVYVPVANHVIAKRYKCTLNSENYDMLEDKTKFEDQGGRMADESMIAFERCRYFLETMRLREIDDMSRTGALDNLPVFESLEADVTRTIRIW